MRLNLLALLALALALPSFYIGATAQPTRPACPFDYEIIAALYPNIHKVGMVVTLEEEMAPYLTLLNMCQAPKLYAWMNKQPFQIYESIHNGVFYRMVWNGVFPDSAEPKIYGGTAMMTFQGAIPASIALLADGFRPDLMLHAGTTGGWTAEWPLNSIGVCANGRSIVFAQRNITDGTPTDLAYGWGSFPCADIPQAILDANNVRLTNIATIDTFIPTIEGQAAFVDFHIDQLEMEGAAVASQAVLYDIPFIKTAGVANSYVDLSGNCAPGQGFSCWNSTCWKLAEATVGVLNDFLSPNSPFNQQEQKKKH